MERNEPTRKRAYEETSQTDGKHESKKAARTSFKLRQLWWKRSDEPTMKCTRQLSYAPSLSPLWIRRSFKDYEESNKWALPNMSTWIAVTVAFLNIRSASRTWRKKCVAQSKNAKTSATMYRKGCFVRKTRRPFA